VEELRQELGSDLSDDDLLLKVLIPGGAVRRGGSTERGASPAAGRSAPSSTASSGAASATDVTAVTPATAPSAVTPDLVDGPRYFTVDVDGEVFNVKVSPATGGDDGVVAVEEAGPPSRARDLPEGAIVAGAPGLVLSVLVEVGDTVAEGDEVALMEIMKMRRYIRSSQRGAVKEIWAQAGQMVEAEDVLLVVD